MLRLKCLFVVLLTFVEAVEYNRVEEGYPTGLIPDCPGSWKRAIIKPKTLKKLFMSVVGDNHVGFTGHYNYYGMDQLVKNPDIDFKKKTWIYISGYLEANAWNAGRNLGYDYKTRGYNVICLDTLEFTARYYPHAVRLSRAVGKHLAEMLVKLTNHGLDPKKLEITGMSLGAHMMGFAAKEYRRVTGHNISLLTSLDAAGPCFRLLGQEHRLDKSDADFVVNILTTIDISSISFHYAHVSFYVNGGAYQEGDIAWLPCDSLCSHSRAYFVYWAAVVHPKAFVGVRCETVQQARDGDCYHLQPMVTNTMGPFTDKNKPGIYYLRTSNRWPYALGKRGLVKPQISTYFGVKYSRNAEGYPSGLFSDCPGSWKPAVIKPKTLKKLFISVLGEGHTGFTGHYNYYGMDQLAKSPDIDFRKQTWIYVGGYFEGNAFGSGKNLGYDYKAMGYNALSLDTLEFTTTYYPVAARLARTVGKHAAEMLVELTRHGLDPKKLEITGMSLGAQTMGYIAKNYRQMTGQNISLLTALDGAGACFRNLKPDDRLDKSDADFVVSVLTTIDISSISVPYAHVTFYVNGGEFQEGNIPWLPCDAICSHSRAYFVWWAAVVHPGAFIAVRCETVQHARDGDCYDVQPMVTNTMDVHTDRSKPGIFYLRTSNKWPYALGRHGLKKPKV